MTAYIYNADTLLVVATINSDDQNAIETYYSDNFDPEVNLLTYAPAFGFANGLRGYEDNAEEIDLCEDMGCRAVPLV